MKSSFVKNEKFGKILLFPTFFLLFLLVLPSCSERKVPPIPKHHPELLLEVLEKGAREDYSQMLPRVRKLRALEPSSVFLPQLEGAVSLNILVKEINKTTRKADFARALLLVKRYETIHGPGKETDQVKAQLQNLVEMDSLLRLLSRTPRSASILAADLHKMELLEKKMNFSAKIRNFMEEKRSYLTTLQKMEYRQLLFGLWSDTDFLIKTGVPDAAQALAAVFAAETRGNDPYPVSLPGVKREMLEEPGKNTFLP